MRVRTSGVGREEADDLRGPNASMVFVDDVCTFYLYALSTYILGAVHSFYFLLCKEAESTLSPESFFNTLIFTFT